jgi:predicted LPLAT superfamily acyltransferase
VTGSWKHRREVGGRHAVRLIHAVSRVGGRGAARVLLYPIALYFMWRRPAERRDSRAYLGRVLGRRAGWRDVLRHIHTFSATILDRVFLLGGDGERFDVTVRGLEELHALMDEGRGVLLFGSHLGSFEVLRVFARQRPDCVIRVVFDKGHNPAVTEVLEALNPEVAATVIDAGRPGPAIMLDIQEAARQGALIALLVDRIQPGEPTVSVPFLGAPARFPVAPWLIAAVLRVPVALAFGLYRGGNRYDLVFERFSDGLAIPRSARATAVPDLVRRYAARLEHHVRDAPFNWFNFYDFWEHDGPASEPPAPGPAAPVADVAGAACPGRDGHGRGTAGTGTAGRGLDPGAAGAAGTDADAVRGDPRVAHADHATAGGRAVPASAGRHPGA